MSLTITHNAAEGTLIEGTSKGDGSNTVLKTNRWRWSRNLGSWFIPQSRDRQAKRGQIQATVAGLREAGFEVAVEIDDHLRSATETEADRTNQALNRAEALKVKAQRRAQQADQAQEQAEAAMSAVPQEPIKVGHYSESRHRKAIDTAETKARKALSAREEATLAAGRARTAAASAQNRDGALVVARRIERMETELRGVCRDIASSTGDRRGRLEHQKASLEDHLDYWRKVRADQLASGEAREFSQDTISPGDSIKIGGSWHVVARANKKTCTVWFDQERGVTNSNRAPYSNITDHKKAA